MNKGEKGNFALPNVYNESDNRKTGNLFVNNNHNNPLINEQQSQNNNIISLIQGKNELKEYEMNIQSPTEKRSTYYLSNQFSNKVN